MSYEQCFYLGEQDIKLSEQDIPLSELVIKLSEQDIKFLAGFRNFGTVSSAYVLYVVRTR